MSCGQIRRLRNSSALPCGTTRLLFWVIVAPFVLASCAEVSLPPTSQKREDAPDQELWDAKITFIRNSLPVTTLQAGHIAKFSRRSLTYLDSGVVVDFFNEEGQHTSRLTADKGQVDEIRKDLLAIGNVVAVTDSGATLRTPALRWENQSRRIISDTEVILTTHTDTLYGIGFVSDEHLQNWEIQKPTGRSFRRWEDRPQRERILTDTTQQDTFAPRAIP